jgi:putative drug exporter of the RND superfamily
MLAMSRFVLRRKGAVAVFWLVVLVAGGAASAKLSSRLSPQFALPGAAGYQANQQILRLYGNGGNGYPEVAVVRLPPGQNAASPAMRLALHRAFAAATTQVSGLRVADYADTGDREFLGRDGRTTYGLVFTPYAGELSPPSLGPQITAAMTPRLPPGSTVAVTGMNELQSGDQAREGFGVLAETLLAGAAALAVLVLVFGSALALVPLLVAVVAIPACFLAIYGLAEITTVSVIVQYLAALIGLGVATDYSLLLVTRWREELAAGHPAPGSCRPGHGHRRAFGRLQRDHRRDRAAAADRAARSRAAIHRDRRDDRPRRQRRRHPDAAARPPGHRGPPDGLAAPQPPGGQPGLDGVGATGGAPPLGRRPGRGRGPGRPRHGRAGDQSWRARGQLAWHDHPSCAGTAHPRTRGHPRRGARPDRDSGPGRREPGGAGGASGVPARGADRGRACQAGLAPPRHRPRQCPARRRALHSEGRGHPGQRSAVRCPIPGALAGGPGALLLDENHAFYGRFPLLVAVLAVVTVVLLAKAFGSLLLPFKAVLLNLASVGATYGVIVLIWQHGYGSHAIWSIPATGAITNWVPLIAFAFLYGLSMDYEVFILTRIREEHDRSRSTATATVQGIGRTGRLVTGAALILFLAFAALSTGPETDLKVMATALGAGILLDAIVVRALLVPALIAILGGWNWWLPRPLHRLLRIPAPPSATGRQVTTTARKHIGCC